MKREILNKEIEKLANNYKEIINKTSDLALKQNDGDIRKARKWLKEQLFYTADRATNELIKLSIDNILDYQGVSSNETIAEVLDIDLNQFKKKGH
ncbi:Phage protein [Lactococcus cremoris]|nr:Phage protein [Lactococcus cremoris]